MVFRTLGPSYPLCHLPDPQVSIPAGDSLTCLGIGQCHLCQSLAAFLGPECSILTQEPCRMRWLGLEECPGPWPVPTLGRTGQWVWVAAWLVGGRELTAVTMGGVGAQADVAGHQEAGEGLSQQTDCLNSWGLLSVGCRAPLVLGQRRNKAMCLSREAFGKTWRPATAECSPGPHFRSLSQPLDKEAPRTVPICPGSRPREGT